MINSSTVKEKQKNLKITGLDPEAAQFTWKSVSGGNKSFCFHLHFGHRKGNTHADPGEHDGYSHHLCVDPQKLEFGCKKYYKCQLWLSELMRTFRLNLVSAEIFCI